MSRGGRIERKADRRQQAGQLVTYRPSDKIDALAVAGIDGRRIDCRQAGKGFSFPDPDEEDQCRLGLERFRNACWSTLFPGNSTEAALQTEIADGQRSLHDLAASGLCVSVATLSRHRRRQWSEIRVRVLAEGLYEFLRREGYLA